MILIVDDDVAMAETCAMFLEIKGFEVSIATSGTEALSQLNTASVELLISDCEMQGMTGLELSKVLKANPATAELPILLMSGSLRCEVAPGTSYDAFLRKPFLAENLLIEVKKLLDAASKNK